MLTITITFALLVALWGFSGALVTYAKRGLQHSRSRPRPARVTGAASRPRRSGSIASASR